MDFQPAPEVLDLAGQARRLFEQGGDLGRALELSGADPCLDARLWDEIARLGWADLFEDADMERDVAIDACVALLCEVGRSQAAVPLASRLTSGWMLARLDPERTLTRTGGASIAALVRDAQWRNPDQLVLDAPTGEADQLVLDGAAELVREGAVATELLCVVPSGGRRIAVRVSADAAGVKITPRRTTGRLREATIRFDGVTVSAGQVLPEPFDDTLSVELSALLTLLDAAELVGLGRRLLELAVDHAGARVQFGRPIGQFQAVRHRLADMLIDVDVAAALVYRLAAALGHGEEPGAPAAWLAVWNRRAMRRVALGAHQVHGGVGFIRDHPLHLMFGRVTATGPGNTAKHREVLGGAVPSSREEPSGRDRAKAFG